MKNRSEDNSDLGP